jgi:hypothetical protein
MGIPFMRHAMLLIEQRIIKDMYVSFLKFSLGSGKPFIEGWASI